MQGVSGPGRCCQARCCPHRAQLTHQQLPNGQGLQWAEGYCRLLQGPVYCGVAQLQEAQLWIWAKTSCLAFPFPSHLSHWVLEIPTCTPSGWLPASCLPYTVWGCENQSGHHPASASPCSNTFKWSLRFPLKKEIFPLKKGICLLCFTEALSSHETWLSPQEQCCCPSHFFSFLSLIFFFPNCT